MGLFRIVPAIAALLILVAVPAHAQEPQEAPTNQRQIMMELQQIQQQLAGIRQKALAQNPELQQRQQEVREAVRAAMIEANPELEATFERLDELKSEFQAARQEQDIAKLQSLMAEARTLQPKVLQAHEQAMQREEIAEQTESYQDQLIVAMKQTDPETEDLLARLEELAAKLRAPQQPS